MELKTIVAIGLVVFIVGALIFLKISGKTKYRPGRLKRPPKPAETLAFYIPEKIKGGFYLCFISLIQT